MPDGEGGTLKVQPKEVTRSGMHYLGGELLKFDDVPDDKEHSILRGNMRCNKWPVCIVNRNSWRHTAMFEETDCIVGPSGEIVRSGNDPDLMVYRAEKNAEFEAYYEDLRKQYATS